MGWGCSVKKCVKCGNEYQPYANNQRRCNECRHLTCAHCGKRWIPANSNTAEKFCSRTCADVHLYDIRVEQARSMPRGTPRSGPRHKFWKGDAAPAKAKRERAVRLYPEMGQCERCGAPATLRHHKDENTGNNDRSNIEFLCKRCHTIHHRGTVPRPCSVCARERKPLRRGMCNRCYESRRKSGALYNSDVKVNPVELAAKLEGM